MTINHNHYLELAFHLAEKNLGQTKLNPSVGTVIVKNGAVISSGVTSFKGRPHSEFNALHNLKNCSGASLYTTLEPCTHYGKTPPCTNQIIKSKIKRVIYSSNDIDKRTSKKAYSLLKSKKINVKKGILISESKKFYKKYFQQKVDKKPFVAAKIACSNDFFVIK